VYAPDVVRGVALLCLLSACASGARTQPLVDDGGARRVDGGPSGGADAGDGECKEDVDCDDGLVCTGVETCVEDICIPGVITACDDSNPCTSDTCREPAADCDHAPDDSLCAPTELCDLAMGCVPRPACSGAAECDDGLACTGAESCDPSIGCQSGARVGCDDGVSCTTDSCVEPSGACTNVGPDADGDGYTAAGCADGNDCADDSVSINPGAAEICDGRDNNCNTALDEGFECAMGSPAAVCTTACSTPGTRTCDGTCRFGACAAATETCMNACDDDLDSRVDEGCMAPPPPNDTCAGAITLSGTGVRMADTLVGATAQITDCGTGTEVFYRVTVTARSIFYLDTMGTGFDTRISYRGTACPGASALCLDDSCATLQTQMARVLEAGTHYFSVHTFSSTTVAGPLALRFQTSPAAAGDNVEITTTGTFTGSTTGASGVGASCGSAAASAEDSFYFMLCPATARTVTATTCNAGTTYDTVLHMQGVAGEIACNDDDTSCALDSLRSRISTSLSGAGVYVVYVDGYSSGSTGSYQTSITW
jgi:hypothetical protein